MRNNMRLTPDNTALKTVALVTETAFVAFLLNALTSCDRNDFENLDNQWTKLILYCDKPVDIPSESIVCSTTGEFGNQRRGSEFNIDYCGKYTSCIMGWVEKKGNYLNLTWEYPVYRGDSTFYISNLNDKKEIILNLEQISSCFSCSNSNKHEIKDMSFKRVDAYVMPNGDYIVQDKSASNGKIHIVAQDGEMVPISVYFYPLDEHGNRNGAELLKCWVIFHPWQNYQIIIDDNTNSIKVVDANLKDVTYYWDSTNENWMNTPF